MNLFDLTGEVAAVIGGTGVLGGAIAEGLAQAGAKVAVLGRNAERGEARARIIQKAGGQSRFVAADAMSRATVTAEKPLEQLPFEAWKNNFDLNLVGGLLFPCQEFGPGMVSCNKGSIINIASVSAHIPLSRVLAYSASKAAVLSLTQFLAREWATKGVRVNSITPGFFPAEQNRRLLFNPDGSPTARAQAAMGHTPMGRFGEAQELIGAAVFLASPKASSFVTGTDIRVDGGFLAQTI
jgi:NAD(P)-dependent dehydrogenase (short-subunit alcohol dehydrogenase family)